jgi:hypothetical protein
MTKSGFEAWLDSLRLAWDSFPDALVFALLTVGTLLFIVSLCLSIIRIFTRSIFFDLAGRDDILQDKLQNPYSFYDGTYELPKKNIKAAMLYANLSYHTFWNAVIMYRYRLCGAPTNRMYFRVNRWRNHDFLPFGLFTATFRFTMLFSLCFIWGYLIFLPIVLIRMKLYARKQPLY